jgi:acyl-CoA synthetase (AMP-forming)/AMP-acid ligase II
MRPLATRLEERARRTPRRAAVTFLDGEGRVIASLDAAALMTGAERFAASFEEAGGRAVLLPAEPTPDFVAALCGCLIGGGVAVPVPPALRPRTLDRLEAIVADAGAGAIADTGPASRRLAERFPGLGLLEMSAADAGACPSPDPKAPALLQYTSGSTGTPKRVAVSQGNLAANLDMLQVGFGASAESRILSWLPLHHDMGLVAQLLLALHCGAEILLMEPLSFIRRPQAWLTAVARHGATISGAPDFAYALCLRRVRPAMLAGLDFSAWEVAFCGAEPVRPTTLRRFADLLAPQGFARRALLPCYGLAEATVYVSGGPPGQGLKTRIAGDGREVVSCGRPAGSVIIVDPATGKPVPDGAAGEIRVAGPHVAAGNTVDTGDLGFMADGELFVTGRLKDLIIHRGENLHPSEIEATIAAADGRLGPAGAVFAVEADEGERIAAVFEAKRALPDNEALPILRAVAEAHGVKLHDLLLVAPGQVPRTTSGKVRRRACRDLYRAGALKPAPVPAAAAVPVPAAAAG